MERPRVIVTATMSIDGRIAFWPHRILLEPEVGAVWVAAIPPGAVQLLEERDRLLKDRFGNAAAVLNGSGSFVIGTPDPLPPADRGAVPPIDEFLLDAVRDRPAPERWFVVTDSRGQVRWTTKQVDGSDLLVLVSRSTPREYLQYLRTEQICYLVVGEDRIDFGLALQRLRERLGVTTVLADGGGGLNGELLRAGLVDQLEVVIAPMAVGGRGIPTLFDGKPLVPDDLPTPLSLTASKTSPDGGLWLSYEVGKPAAP